MAFHPGDKVLHRFNRDLGPGEVVSVERGRLRVHFPRRGETIEFAVRDHAFTELVLPPGADPSRWYETFHEDMVERLARLEIDRLSAWENRLESLRLLNIREAKGLGSFLGGRIEIYPHQIHVAEQAVTTDPVRWLLADEVGLGKTVEACLILSHLARARRADRILIVAPASLTVQWLGELYRKFHQVFVLLDRDRRRDVTKDLGPEFNPFEVHARSVISLEDLVAEPRLAEAARAANLDLLVVDEAHRLERRPGHPGSPAYRAVEPLAETARHVLLLSATPLEADAHGFFRLLQILRPQAYASWDKFREDLDRGLPLFPCTSATRRADIGGLPPRIAEVVELPPAPELEAREVAALTLRVTNPLELRRRAEALQAAWALPSGAEDPRLKWILAEEPGWWKRGEKMLIFVHSREALEILKREIERTTFRRVAVFHEDLTPAAQDLEVAQFAQAEGPNVLISTEAGGEGRNFHFCRGLVLFDLPWDPVLVEQRIGRLDRINRTRPVEITLFLPHQGFARDATRLYQELGIFREPLGGLDRSLAHVEEALQVAAGMDPPTLDIEAVVEETHEARRRMNQALYQDLHRNRYRPDLAPSILSRVPPELETFTERVVLEACRQFGFETIPKTGRNVWYVEFGPESTVDHLPGVPEGTRWLGTFNREEGVERETLDFFASGHPLVEGVLMELEDGHRGEVALYTIAAPGMKGEGLGAILRRGPEILAVVVDTTGRRRPEWAPYLLAEPGHRREVTLGDWGLSTKTAREAWAERVRALLYPLQSEGRLTAVAAFRFE